MPNVHVRLELPEGDLLDASDDIQRLLVGDGELVPPLRHVLLAIDDAITDALIEAPEPAPGYAR